MLTEEIGGWQATLAKPRPVVPLLGSMMGVGTLIGISASGALPAWVAILGSVLVAGVGISASRPTKPLVLRRNGDMLICERGAERLFAAPLGDILEVRLQAVQGQSKMVIHRLGKRWYDVPGLHDTALLSQIRDRLHEEAPAIEQTEDAPADLEGLRGVRVREEA